MWLINWEKNWLAVKIRNFKEERYLFFIKWESDSMVSQTKAIIRYRECILRGIIFFKLKITRVKEYKRIWKLLEENRGKKIND